MRNQSGNQSSKQLQWLVWCLRGGNEKLVVCFVGQLPRQRRTQRAEGCGGWCWGAACKQTSTLSGKHQPGASYCQVRKMEELNTQRLQHSVDAGTWNDRLSKDMMSFPSRVPTASVAPSLFIPCYQHNTLCNKACNLKPGVRVQGQLSAFSRVWHSEFPRWTMNLNYVHAPESFRSYFKNLQSSRFKNIKTFKLLLHLLFSSIYNWKGIFKKYSTNSPQTNLQPLLEVNKFQIMYLPRM